MATAAHLLELIRSQPADRAEIASHLDALSPAARLEAVRSLRGAGVQRRLWEAVASAPPVGIDEIVPPDAPPLREFIYHGKNSLPAFTLFEKRFCRPSQPEATGRLWGYNHTDVARFVGPGYFVCHAVDGPGAAIDYRAVPSERPAAWPAIRENGRGLSYFVYRDMVDYLRRVSEHVLIGSAFRHGKEQGNYFMLCRED
jgi:hypothetical protein